MRVRRGIAVVSVVCGAWLAWSSSAHAFGLENLSATPASTQAGANTDYTISLDVTEPDANLRDLTVHLPPGLVGNPLATPQCTEAQLNANACPDESVVGSVSNDVTLHVLGFLPVPQTVNGQLFNMVPQPGEPARFGIVLTPLPVDLPIIGNALLPPIITQSPARLRPGDFGLDSVLENLPNTATVAGTPIDININGIDLTLFGEAGDPPQGFIRSPTSCKEHTVGFDAVAYDESTASGTTAFTTTGCENLPFSPEFSARAKIGEPGEPIELSTTIAQTIDEAGLKRAAVTLPPGISGLPSALANVCPRATFQTGGCPDNTIVGSAVAASPLQSEPLAGPVYVVEPAVPGLPDIGLDLRGSLALKLTGALALLPSGRNLTTFEGLPDIPIDEFTLTFPAERGLIGAIPDICEKLPAADASFLAHSGAALDVTAPVTYDGCGKPTAKVEISKLDTGKPRVRLRVNSGTTRVSKVRAKFPRKLSLANGKKFKRRASLRADGQKLGKGSLKRSKRVLTARLGSAGVRSLQAKLRGGAVRAKRRAALPLQFKLTVVGADGERTNLSVLATR